MNTHRKATFWIGACMAFLISAAPLLAQTGSISGAVRTEAGEPLGAAQITIPGTSLGTLTRENGRYVLLRVPAGVQQVQAELIGYGTVTQEVTVRPGETATLDITMSSQAVSLQEIIVTGVAGATQKAKVPFTVDQVSSEDMPVPAISPANAIQGKVAGATVVSGSGRPGAAPSILLRGATSLDASGRSQEPLYIVDGVILGSSVVDISGLDIESIEVIKGAAAASLYGSRAGNGVIQITTKRGRGLSSGEVRYTLRSEYGQSQLPGEFLLSKEHRFLLNDAGTMFIDADGSECNWLDCSNPQLAGQAAGDGTANAWNTFQANQWPGGTIDQVDRFFRGGQFMENYVSATGRQGATNFHISFSNTSNEGVMPGKDGLDRNAFRLNVDQTVREDLQVSASATYSRSVSDLGQGELFDLTRMPAGVDLTACESNTEESCLDNLDDMILIPDPTNTESPNPLYHMLIHESQQDRGRFLGSMNVRFSPLSWLNLDSNVSYDRLDTESDSFYPKGYRTRTASTINEGYLSRAGGLSEAINASVTATGRFDLTPDIANTTQLRYLYEQEDSESLSTFGYEFAVADVPTFGNINDLRGASSGQASIRADGYFAITNFDIMDRYIVDALIRNDGSSLFGADQRRQWYYRLAGAWRMSQEEWFPVDAIDELKLRYSYGTAGGRPNFSAQYETYSVSSGSVTPVNLGNRDLRPEFSAEQELGIETLFMNGRFGASLVYANTVTEDQILQIPLPAFTGFSTQYRNAGTLESNTVEASFDARVLQNENMSWTARLLFDRTVTEITQLDVAPYRYGVGGQGLGTVFYAREGEKLGTFYGVQAAESCDHLPEGVSCDGFEVDENGFLVWVGDSSFDDPDWGGNSGDVWVRGAPVAWGTPFPGECEDRTTGNKTLFCEVGNSSPDYSIGLSNTFRFGGLMLYGLVEAVQGFDVYNQPLQWAVFKRTAGIYDQSHVAEADRKPLGYWDGHYAVSGLQPSSIFVEDGSFVKLRELSLAYRIGGSQLAALGPLNAFDGITLSLIGRNLLTFTDYRGYDPEVGSGGGDLGSAALARVDGYQYPNFRTMTFGVEINF